MHTRFALPVGLLTAAALVASCGSDPGGATPAEGAAGLQVVASFYPLEFVTQRVAGDLADVSSLTKPGAEPHDLELTPQDVAALGDADLVVYLAGFQPAIDTAVDTQAADSAFDVTGPASLDLTLSGGAEGGAGDGVALDPHFWLDPIRLGDVADAIATRLGELSPGGAAAFEANAAELGTDLELLDADFLAGLSDCASTSIVTSHSAFEYLARRYGLEQEGIAGLSPEGEPSPQDLAAVTAYVEDKDVTTVYYETLVSPAIAETIAKETGARTAVLDPVEGLNDESAGTDYLQVMRANLATLRKGQGCA